MDRLHARQIQREHGAGHVDDRVHRADLVEVHRLAVRAVHARLGIREPREDSRRSLLHARRQRAALENLENVAKRSLLPMSPRSISTSTLVARNTPS